MNVYYANDNDFINTDIYRRFIDNNPAKGNLRIRAYAASEAVPIEDVNVIVSTLFENAKIIFYEGKTNKSGIIERISLPAPRLKNDNLVVPEKTEYEIEVLYKPDGIKSLYKVNLYEDVCVMQDINIVPEIKVGGFNGN